MNNIFKMYAAAFTATNTVLERYEMRRFFYLVTALAIISTVVALYYGYQLVFVAGDWRTDAMYVCAGISLYVFSFIAYYGGLESYGVDSTRLTMETFDVMSDNASRNRQKSPMAVRKA